MKKLFIGLAAAMLFAACASEDSITPSIEYTNDYELTDDPNDSVQHERYNIYKEFGVPVYFNDTIVRKQHGHDLSGNPIYKYETIDLQWTFFGYNSGTKYKYVYLTDPADQMNALRYVRKYLNTVSKQMRPFNIMLADTLTRSTSSRTEKPLYHVGARSLVLAQVKDVTNEDTIQAQVNAIIKNMIGDRITANSEVKARFANVCAEKGWYSKGIKRWEEMDNCATITKWTKTSWVLSPNELYDEPPFTTYQGQDLVAVLTKDDGYNDVFVSDYVEALKIRRAFIAEMAQYGFLRGWKETGNYPPYDDTEDRQYFVDAILHLGDTGFRRRYGAYSVVMEKYEILANYITNELGVNLNYDGASEEELEEEEILAQQ